MKDFEVEKESELEPVADFLVGLSQKHKIFLFDGEMGAGKTTLIKLMCQKLGVKNEMSSPSYSIVNEYRANGNTIYHFDFYRLKSLEEALDIGVDEYFYSNAVCLIEWPQIVQTILPDTYINVTIALQQTKRFIKVSE